MRLNGQLFGLLGESVADTELPETVPDRLPPLSRDGFEGNAMSQVPEMFELVWASVTSKIPEPPMLS